jgi:prephenate dehydrogenase
MHLKKISLIGAGLLGGSLGLAIRQRKLAATVHAYVRRPESVDECQRLGVADLATQNMEEAVEGADLVVLCTPLSQMRDLTLEMRPFLPPGVVVTDVGSVKTGVAQELEPLLMEVKAGFVGSHPMAGSEKAGLAAARADLFDNAICLVTPTPQSPAWAVGAVQDFWKALGGCPVRMTPEMHDDLVSRSSHLPHVVAAELANYVLSPAHPREQAMVCANGFRDTTRIAASSPKMWRDVALANRRNLSRVLGVFIEDLQEFQLALEREDAVAIEEFFTKARQRREKWRAHSAIMSPE